MIIKEAMYSPYGAKSAAAQASGITDDHLEKIAKYSNVDPVHAGQIFDDITEYDPDSPLSTGSSYEDTERFDREMEDAFLIHKKLLMVREFEKYMAAEDPAIMSALYRVANTPDVHLYVTSVDQDKDFQAPAPEVVRDPEAFHLMAIGTDDNDFPDAVGRALGFDFNGDDMDAILILLEKMAGDNLIGHVPQGYQYSPEHAFIAWLTQNNPNLKIYVDP